MRLHIIVLVSTLFLLIISCKTGNKTQEEEKTATCTPVTVTSVTKGTIIDTVELNAVSAFLLKTNVKATTNGYLQEVNIKLGENVSKGQLLFQVKSKEASTLGNMINKVDSAFHFKGITGIKSPGNGYITQLAYQAGDYIQDGETVATISDLNSLVFLLDLPYELKPFLSNNKHINLSLPDGESIPGTISSALPFVDPVSQTQSYIIRMDKYQSIPENLIAKATFIRKAKLNAVSLPKEAILTNEQQTEFWIMKMINDSIAVKIPIVKGIETSNRVEVITPVLNHGDKILLTGNYGLPDTANVAVEKTDQP
jgi:multidrug efflux pump subunit AcrA (membrane-fusion protein)